MRPCSGRDGKGHHHREDYVDVDEDDAHADHHEEDHHEDGDLARICRHAVAMVSNAFSPDELRSEYVSADVKYLS